MDPCVSRKKRKNQHSPLELISKSFVYLSYPPKSYIYGFKRLCLFTFSSPLSSDKRSEREHFNFSQRDPSWKFTIFPFSSYFIIIKLFLVYYFYAFAYAACAAVVPFSETSFLVGILQEPKQILALLRTKCFMSSVSVLMLSSDPS